LREAAACVKKIAEKKKMVEKEKIDVAKKEKKRS
jgi:hypothetical protein